MYQKFHTFIVEQVQTNQGDTNAGGQPDAAMTAWAVIGLGMMANITQELGLLPHETQGQMVREVGAKMLNSVPDRDSENR